MKIKDILKLEKRKVDIYNFTNRVNLFNIEHSISDYSNVYEEKNTRVQIFEVYNKILKPKITLTYEEEKVLKLF